MTRIAVDRAGSRLFLAGIVAALACWNVCIAAEQAVETKGGVRTEKDIPYVPDGDPAQRLDLYLPETPAEKPVPLVVWVHGGGWKGGSKAGCPAKGMVQKGYAAASVEYRFSQKALFPAQIQDCQAAIRWLRANSKKYGIDPARIGVMGGSAGGHLVALLGTSGGKKAFPPVGGNEDQSDRVQAVCDFYGPADFTTVLQQAEDDKNVKNIFKFNTPSDPYSCLIGAKLGEDKEKTDAVSPVHYVSVDNPPFLILHGTRDALVPFAQSEELAAALEGKGVKVLLQKIPGGGHGGPGFNKPALNELVQKFFDRHLKGEDIPVELVPEADVAVPAEPGKTK
jgi:acetyl esterase/lipase